MGYDREHVRMAGIVEGLAGTDALDQTSREATLDVLIKDAKKIIADRRDAESQAAGLSRTLHERGASDDSLDDLVSDCGGNAAINNAGFDAQVEYLLSEGVTEDQILQAATDA